MNEEEEAALPYRRVPMDKRGRKEENRIHHSTHHTHTHALAPQE